MIPSFGCIGSPFELFRCVPLCCSPLYGDDDLAYGMVSKHVGDRVRGLA